MARSTTIPGFREMMIEKQATYAALARESGLSEIVIYNAIRGLPIDKTSAAVLMQTLEERKFSYKTKRNYYGKAQN